MAVLVGLTSRVLLGSRGGARWIGRAGLLVAVLLVVGGVGALSEFLRPLGAAGFLVSSAWLLVVAASLLGRGVQARRLAMAR
jgi:hypothetical protein